MSLPGLKIGVGLIGPGAIGRTFMKQLAIQVRFDRFLRRRFYRRVSRRP